MNRPPKVLVMGGGISGLSTAWWLSQSGIPVEVWERDNRPGGKIETSQQQGYQMEQAAALLLNFRPEVAEFVERSGLEPHKCSRTPLAEQNRYLLNGGQLNALTMGISNFILSNNWSLQGKLRMMMEPFIPRGGSDNETVSDFITRRFGRELLDKAMEPFVSGTLASDPDLANASATLGRLTALEQKFGSLTLGAIAHKILRKKSACVTETFSFDGGMSTLVEQLAQQPGITFLRAHQANSVEPLAGERWQVSGTNLTTGQEIQRHVDQVIFSTPAPATAALLKPIDTEASQLLQQIEYASLAVLHTGFQRSQIHHPLDGTGFLTPRSEQTPFNGNLWMSSLFRGRAPEGSTLLTSYLGGARHPEVRDWDNPQIIEQSLHALSPILGIHGDPEMVQLHRHQQALPLYHGPYAARMRQLQQHLAAHPGLHLCANYLGGVSVRDRISQGRTVADCILQQYPITDPGNESYWPFADAHSAMAKMASSS
ncbi:MAG: protoporphyrinogen oxidase [Gammaproteobacteria bacterium]|nr:protoporphyrinogen oxidase [Gammaproteobacteria bacterium]